MRNWKEGDNEANSFKGSNIPPKCQRYIHGREHSSKELSQSLSSYNLKFGFVCFLPPLHTQKPQRSIQSKQRPHEKTLVTPNVIMVFNVHLLSCKPTAGALRVYHCTDISSRKSLPKAWKNLTQKLDFFKWFSLTFALGLLSAVSYFNKNTCLLRKKGTLRCVDIKRLNRRGLLYIRDFFRNKLIWSKRQKSKSCILKGCYRVHTGIEICSTQRQTFNSRMGKYNIVKCSTLQLTDNTYLPTFSPWLNPILCPEASLAQPGEKWDLFPPLEPQLELTTTKFFFISRA